MLMSGTGSRFGAPLPKQYIRFPNDSRPVFQVTLEKILNFLPVQNIVLAVEAGYTTKPELLEPLNRLKKKFTGQSWFVVNGGRSRHASFLNGMIHLLKNHSSSRVLVHDANRPFLNKDFLERIEKSLQRLSGYKPCYIPVIPQNDSICQVKNGRVVEYKNRSQIFRIQTPQLLYTLSVKKALGKLELLEKKPDFTDEGSFMKAMGYSVRTFTGDPENVKITYPGDLP